MGDKGRYALNARLGRFMRRTSLDEHPPVLECLERRYVSGRSKAGTANIRRKVQRGNSQLYAQTYGEQPGITGWAQVNGWRGNTDIKTRIEHDLVLPSTTGQSGLISR